MNSLTNDKNREIIMVHSVAELAHRAANIFAEESHKAISEKGYFVVGMSGGNTPRPMYRLLATAPLQTEIQWEQVHIFWVDERMVPYDSHYSNYGVAVEEFVKHVNVPPDNLHPVLVDREAEEAAQLYEKEILEFFGATEGDNPSFDLIFLGLGADGHTASVFPGQEDIWGREKLVVNVEGGEPNLARVTMTPRLINWAKMIVFMVSGKSKAQILRRVLGTGNQRLPATNIRPLEGLVIWLVDAELADDIGQATRSTGNLRLVKTHKGLSNSLR